MNTDFRQMDLEDILRLKAGKLGELHASQNRIKSTFKGLFSSSTMEPEVANNPLLVDFSSIISLVQSVSAAIKIVRDFIKNVS